MACVTPNYEINVARMGRHYCKIELGFMLEGKAVEKFEELTKIFKQEDEKFDLSLTYWDCSGHTVMNSDETIKGGKYAT